MNEYPVRQVLAGLINHEKWIRTQLEPKWAQMQAEILPLLRELRDVMDAEIVALEMICSMRGPAAPEAKPTQSKAMLEAPPSGVAETRREPPTEGDANHA